MNTVLADHDIEGYVTLLWGVLGAERWIETLCLNLATFRTVGLPVQSTDREVWRFAQANRMILLTNNRNMRGENSLERTIREENTPESLPVITVGNVSRLREGDYRERCATRLAEIIMDLEFNLGRGRIYVP